MPTPLPDKRTAAMVRVDHAGEYGAARIYAGQLAVLGANHPMSATVRHMAAQEKRHLERFDRMIVDRRVRPTLLGPVWHVAGFALGVATAVLGPKTAMACTAAVEAEIERHYSAQLEELGQSDPELSTTIEDFKADEVAHRQTALDQGAQSAPGFTVLEAVIRTGCRIAIRASERV